MLRVLTLGLLAAVLGGCTSIPSAPAGRSESFQLSWKPPAGAAIAGYNVYLGSTPTTLRRVNESGLITTNSYQVKGLAVGVYYWAVSAVTAAGAESIKTATVTGSLTP